MNKHSMGFTVLIERRIDKRLAQRLLTALAAAAVALASAVGLPARAQTADDKVASDLQAVLGGGSALSGGSSGSATFAPAMDASMSASSRAPMGGNAARAASTTWSKTINGVTYVRVLIVGTGQDATMAALRSQIVAMGGSVLFRYQSVTAVSAIVPAQRVVELSRRADVQSISPDRPAARTASILETATGAQNLRPAGGPAATLLDGSGVGIAILDSGIMGAHRSFADARGASRRVVGVDFLQASDAQAKAKASWTLGVDQSASFVPGSPALHQYEQQVSSTNAPFPDPYGHGSHVAAVAAGRGDYQLLDTTGIAPNAKLIDVKVLDGQGMGQLSDVLRGIDWVLTNAKTHNIRIMNLSLAADSTESWQKDPLCRAVRSAVAAGITVVVAAGNYGQTDDGKEVYGAIGSPGHDPSVITVGSVNMRGTLARADDTVNLFSSRGPTRGSSVNASGVRVYDHLVKPDLVAPGNRIVSAMSTSGGAGKNIKWTASFLPANFPELTTGINSTQAYSQTLMSLSGTSIAAPAVSGTVALMLQANPGLTPPLIKAILQYTAQPLPDANLLQQGTGLLNVDGAVKLARALRTDLADAVRAGTIGAGDPLLAAGRALPVPTSTVGGVSFNWSRMITVGGNHVVGGTSLLTQYQPIYDPAITWAGDVVRRRSVSYWPATSSVPANTYPRTIVDVAAPNQTLLASGVLVADSLAGQSSLFGRSGIFAPAAQLSAWLGAGSGKPLGSGLVISNGLVLSEGITLAEGLVLSEGLALAEGLTLSEGVVLSEGVLLAESVTSGSGRKRDKPLRGE